MSLESGTRPRAHVAVFGDGPRTAVLVHGIMADHRCWRRVIPMLVEHGYRVLAVDLPGHGLGGRGTDYRPRVLSEAVVEAIAPLLGSPPELMIGHSLGGRIVDLASAELSPRRIVYLDPAFGQPHEAIARPGRWLLGAVVRPGLSIALLRLFSHRDAEDRALTISMIRRWDRRTWTGLRERDAIGLPAAATVPSLVIIPRGSNLVSRRTAGLLRASGHRVSTVRTRSHVLFRDDYPGFLRAIQDWL